MTNDLKRRLNEHRSNLIPGFTGKYNVFKLLYFESLPNKEEAVKREQVLKRWRKQWKKNLIESFNKEWEDLAYLVEGDPATSAG